MDKGRAADLGSGRVVKRKGSGSTKSGKRGPSSGVGWNKNPDKEERSKSQTLKRDADMRVWGAERSEENKV